MTSGGLGGAVLVALVAIVPLVVLMLTSFVKLSVVLALLRNAIGAPDAPSGLVVMGIALVLTFFVMAPVAIDMVRAAATTASRDGGTGTSPDGKTTPADATAARAESTTTPVDGTSTSVDGKSTSVDGKATSVDGKSTPVEGKATPVDPKAGPLDATGAPLDAKSAPAGPLAPLEIEPAVRELVPAAYRAQLDAAERALGPLRAFLGRHAADRDRDTFTSVAHQMGRAAVGDELWVLAPAFLATELREAFAIAVLIFLPFLVIDLVVGLGLAALGLMSTQPQTIALPLKLLLFVAVDGWRLLLDALLRGYV